MLEGILQLRLRSAQDDRGIDGFRDGVLRVFMQVWFCVSIVSFLPAYLTRPVCALGTLPPGEGFAAAPEV